MSHFVDAVGSQYVYQRNGHEYKIDRDLLCALFRNYGYGVDPGSQKSEALSTIEIEQLHELARARHDLQVIKCLDSISRKPPVVHSAQAGPSTKERHFYNTIFNERQRFTSLDGPHQNQILKVLILILEIGLYLGGWRGPEEPYITGVRPITDPVRCELRIMPKIEALYLNPTYASIKNFPIISHYQSGTEASTLKPAIKDTALNLDIVLNLISIGDNSWGPDLILTTYYYLTIICSRPQPMIELLIQSLAS